VSEEFEYLVKGVNAKKTSKRCREEMKTYAEEAFKDHVITEEGENVFRCGQPDTIIHSYRVAFLPAGMIVVYGDIGEMMIQRGGEGWLRGAIRHDYVSDYIMEKVRPVRRIEAFMPGDALIELRQIHDGIPEIDHKGVNFVEQAIAEGDEPCDSDWEVKPDPEGAEKIAREWLLYNDGDDGEAWSRAIYEHTGDCEYNDCRDYTTNDLWCYYALSWFIRKRAEVSV